MNQSPPIQTEDTPLLSSYLGGRGNEEEPIENDRCNKKNGLIFASLFSGAILLGCMYSQISKGILPDVSNIAVETIPMYEEPLPNASISSFPSKFVWGVATSAYQIEGATREDGRGPSVWDVFVEKPGAILDGSNGNIADDHYHLWKDDLQIMCDLDITAYRFSISWSRILPTGRGEVNQKGIDFYDHLIDALLDRGITPWVTLFHWDLPQALEDDFGGWLDERTIEAFEEYSRVVFEHFSHKVKHFITLNEPWTYSVLGHSTGVHAPGHKDHPDTEPYIVAHNFLIAHARVFHLYKKEFGNGMIGIANCGDFRYGDAGERAMLFQWGWFTDPLIYGDYPTVMRERVGDRLPVFTAEQATQIINSFDFIGLNYYESYIATTPKKESPFPGYWADMHADFSGDPSWRQNDMEWNMVPKGLYDFLLWVKERYGNPLLYITENGTAEKEPTKQSAIDDTNRQNYIRDHLQACAAAIQDGSNLMGYFVWSLLDNFEWALGYKKRFGIVRVDYDTQERTIKGSAEVYRDIIRSNREEMAMV